MTFPRLAGLAGLAALLGAPMLTAGFLIADDLVCVATVVDAVHAGWRHIFDPLFGSPRRPPLFGWMALNYDLWGGSAAPWRAVGIGLEAASAVVLAALVARTGARPGWATAVALLWACSPVRFEHSIVHMHQKDLAAAFTVAGMLSAWRWSETGRDRWLWAASAAVGIGVMAYPIAVCVPLAMFLVAPPPGRSRRPLAVAFLPWVLAWFLAEVGVAAVLHQSRMPSSLDQGWWSPIWVLRNMVGAVSRTVLPFSASLDPAEPSQRVRWLLEAGAKLAVAAGAAWAGVRAWRRSGGGRFWVGWVVAATVFVSLRWIVDGRHLAVLGMGLCGLLGVVASDLGQGGRRALAIGTVIVGGWGMFANARTLAETRSAARIVSTTLATLATVPAGVREVILHDLPRTGDPPGAIIYANGAQIAAVLRLFQDPALPFRVDVTTGPVVPSPGLHYRYVGGRLVPAGS